MRLLAFAALIVSSSANFTDCDNSTFADCTVFGVAGSQDCTALIGDGVCDWGQRILSNGDPGPNLNCAQFLNTAGPSGKTENDDCDCPNGTLTCSGYCLSDSDCESVHWGKSNCHDWRRDDVCDFGQRSSDANIEIHFECEQWNWDNLACDQSMSCDDILLNPLAAEMTCPDPALINMNRGDPSEEPTSAPSGAPSTVPSWSPTPLPSEQPTSSPIEFRECTDPNDPTPGMYIRDCQERCVPRKYYGDGICDWGQRTIRTKWDFDFRCPELLDDDGDCRCADTITCDGYCLTDQDCSSTHFKKSSCIEWTLDNICDFGQRVADSGIEINFECSDWNFDNLACDRNPQDCVIDQAFADATCDPGYPTEAPTHYPTSLPTISPTDNPTTNPSGMPSGMPSEEPTHFPTHYCPNGLVDCDGNCWDDCQSSWLPGHKDAGVEGCFSYIGDGVCDMGQRLLRFEYDANGDRSNYWGPNLNCKESVMGWGAHMNTATNAGHAKAGAGGWDGGDCDIPACTARGGVMTCDGFCLTDSDCEAVDLGYTTCMDWKNDSTCDYGQRYSDANININFNCDMHAAPRKPWQTYGANNLEIWGDNGWCPPPSANDTCESILAECPTPADTIEPTDVPTLGPTEHTGAPSWSPTLEPISPTGQPSHAPTAFFSDCDGTIWQHSDDCMSSWIPGHRQQDCGASATCCDSYIGDGVCDWGQRLIRSGKLGPNLNCVKFNWDEGDCECDAAQGKTMTCDGFCLEDKDCKNAHYGYTTCAEWYAKSDDVCDHGQRTSEIEYMDQNGVAMTARLNLNFNCEESIRGHYFGYDGGMCEYNGPDNMVCEWILDQECEADPTSEPTQGPSTPPVDCQAMNVQPVTCWDMVTVMEPDENRNCAIDDCPPCPSDTQRCPDDPNVTVGRELNIKDANGVGCQFDMAKCPVDPCKNLPVVPDDCPNDHCIERQRNGDGCITCVCVQGQNDTCQAMMGPGLMTSNEQVDGPNCDLSLCSDFKCGQDECAYQDVDDCCNYKCHMICTDDTHTCVSDGVAEVKRDPHDNCEFRMQDCPNETDKPTPQPTTDPTVMPTEPWMKPLEECYEVDKVTEAICSWYNVSDVDKRALSNESKANCERACAIDPNCIGIQYKPADINGQGRDCDLIEQQGQGCNFAMMDAAQGQGDYNVSSKYCFNMDCPVGEYWEESAKKCKVVTPCSFPVNRSTRDSFCNGHGEPREGDVDLAGTCVCSCDEGYLGDHCEIEGRIEFAVKIYGDSYCSDPQCNDPNDDKNCLIPTPIATVEEEKMVFECFPLNNDGIGESAQVFCSNGRLAMSIFGMGDANCANAATQTILWDDQGGCVPFVLAANGSSHGQSSWDGTGCPKICPPDEKYDPATKRCMRVPPPPTDDLPLCGCFGYYSPANAGEAALCRSQVQAEQPQCFAQLDASDPAALDDCSAPRVAGNLCARACDDQGQIIYEEKPCRPEPRLLDCQSSRDCGQAEYCESVWFDENEPQKQSMVDMDMSLNAPKCVACPDSNQCPNGKCTYEDMVCCGAGWGRTWMGETNERMCPDGVHKETRECLKIDLQGRFVARWSDVTPCPVTPGGSCMTNGSWSEVLVGEFGRLTCPETPETIAKCDIFGWANVEGCGSQQGPFELSRECLMGGTWDASRPGICPGLEFCPAMDGFERTAPGSTAWKWDSCQDGQKYKVMKNCELAAPGACVNADCWEQEYINYVDYPFAQSTTCKAGFIDVCDGLNNRKCSAQVGVCEWCGMKCATLKAAGGPGCPAAPSTHPCESIIDETGCVDPIQNGGMHCEWNKKACSKGVFSDCLTMKKNSCSKATYCDYTNSCVPHAQWGYEFGTCSSDPFSIACDVQATKATCEAEAGCGWNAYYEVAPTKAPTEVGVTCDQIMDMSVCGARPLCNWVVSGPDAYCTDGNVGCAVEDYGACPNYGKKYCVDLYGMCCKWTSNKKGCESNAPAPTPVPGGGDSACWDAVLAKDSTIVDSWAESDFDNCDCGKGDKKMCKKLKKDKAACAANACCVLKGSKCAARGKIKKAKDPCKKACKKQKAEKKCVACNKCLWDGAACADMPPA